MGKWQVALAMLAVLFLCATTAMAAAPGDIAKNDVDGLEVITLCEVARAMLADLAIGATPEQLAKYMPGGETPGGINAFAVRMNGKTILFDTGLGKGVHAALEKAGIDRASVDLVVITHLHFDHFGGLLTEDGKPAFPKAKIILPEVEKAYWYSDQAKNAAPADRREGFDTARKYIDAYGAGATTFAADHKGEIFPGVTPVAAYGHTPGHTGYLLKTNGKGLLLWGDLTHLTSIQFPLPGVAVQYDVDPVKAVEARKAVMKLAADNGWTIGGMHLPFPAIGAISRDGDGYRYDPVK